MRKDVLGRDVEYLLPRPEVRGGDHKHDVRRRRVVVVAHETEAQSHGVHPLRMRALPAQRPAEDHVIVYPHALDARVISAVAPALLDVIAPYRIPGESLAVFGGAVVDDDVFPVEHVLKI